MSKEQIEEIKHDVFAAFGGYEKWEEDWQSLAEALYNEGYRKQSEGEWTKHLDEWDCEYAKCSCCGEEFYDSSGEDTIDIFYKFCPNCGARMSGGQNE